MNISEAKRSNSLVADEPLADRIEVMPAQTPDERLLQGHREASPMGVLTALTGVHLKEFFGAVIGNPALAVRAVPAKLLGI